MVSLLESKLKAAIAKGFQGKLLQGTLRREAPAGRDTYGDATGAVITTFTFEGIRETWTARYKAMAGIPETDVSILILQGSFNPVTVVTKEDQNSYIYMSTPWLAWYKVRNVLEVDPAGASARLQVYEVPAP